MKGEPGYELKLATLTMEKNYVVDKSIGAYIRTLKKINRQSDKQPQVVKESTQ